MMTDPTTPIACTLTSNDAAAQALEWTDLNKLASAVDSIPTGVRMTFPLDLKTQVEDLARRESECCGFMSLSTSEADGGLALEITSQHPEAAPMISLLCGLAE